MGRSTIKDVAGAAGVSTATVSHVLNETKFVSAQTRQKVLSAVQDLGFRPSGVASSLRRKSSRVIGLVLPMQDQDTSAAFFTQLAAGIENAVAADGYRTIISNSLEDTTRQQEQLRMLSGQFMDFIDGLILAPAVGQGAEPASLASDRALPVLYVDRLPRDHAADVDFVGTDNYAISVTGLERFLAQGRHNVACISSPIDVSSMLDRRAAFLDTFSAVLPDAADRIIVTHSSYEAGYRAGLEVLDRHPGLDGLFLTNNTVAMGVVRALQERLGPRAREVGLLVYDHFDWMDLIDPPMDAIAQPAFAMGERAGQVLLDRLRNPDAPLRHETIPSQLIIHDLPQRHS